MSEDGKDEVLEPVNTEDPQASNGPMTFEQGSGNSPLVETNVTDTSNPEAQTRHPEQQNPQRTLKEELKETLDRHFSEVMGLLAKRSVGVVMETGEQEGEPYTNTLFVLEDEKQTPEDLREIVLSMGFDNTVSAHIFPEGDGLLVQTPVSDGRMEEILSGGEELDEKLRGALEEVRQKSLQHAHQVSLLEVQVLRQSIAASVGNTYAHGQ